jgi:acyl-CoA synthetase (AMP-forming)/AMP-acid ligase II
MGLIGHVIQPLYSGIVNHFLPPAVFAARPIRWLQVMAQYGGTISGGPDSAFALCNRRIDAKEIAALDLSRWRLAYCGSERIRPATLNRFARQLGPAGFDRHALYPCYGLAESTLFVSGRHGLQSTAIPGSGGSVHAASVGASMPDTRVAVTDPDTGRSLPDRAIGEICLGSPSVAKGYEGDPVSSARRLSRAEGGAWPLYRTGDLGFRQEGELYVTGRVDNCFQHHGRNLFVEDIEAAVMATEPEGIARCAAFVVEPDESQPGAQIVLVLEHDGKAGRGKAEAYLEQVPGIVSLASGLLPHDVQLWPRGSIPLTTSGKIRRNHCRVLYLEALHRQRFSTVRV